VTRVRLSKPLERVLASGHPWIFRDALAGPLPAPGAVVTVTGARGRFVARGFADAGPIGVRVLTTRDEPLDAGLLERRVRAAAALRDRVVPEQTTAYRLLHGEGDRLPGIVCDVYGEHAVLRFDGKGAATWRDALLEILLPVLGDRGVHHLLERSGRGKQRRVTALLGESPDAPLDVLERGMRLRTDLVAGQKTGLFLDHRESRWRVRDLADGLTVLNLYGYTGGFSAAAGLGGATGVDTVDSAAGAIALAGDTWRINALDPERHRGHVSDVRAFLEGDAHASSYDLVIADPPSFAPAKAKRKAALGAYRELHRGALALVNAGGRYLAASCSSHVDREAFEQTVREGARRAGRRLQVLERCGAPADHPRLAAFPEGDYLKVLLLRVF